MTNTTIQLVKSYKFFYRDYYRKALKVVIYCQFVILALVVANFYFATHRPIPGYYASSNAGIITGIKVLNQPGFSKATLDELGGSQ